MNEEAAERTLAEMSTKEGRADWLERCANTIAMLIEEGEEYLCEDQRDEPDPFLRISEQRSELRFMEECLRSLAVLTRL